MLSFAFVLALVSLAFELMIAARSRTLRKLAGSRLSINLGVSLGLSVVLGVLFGAVGLIALTAGLMSTVMAIPVYRFLYWNYDSPQAVVEGGNRLAFRSHRLKNGLKRVVLRLRSLVTCVGRAGLLIVRLFRIVAGIGGRWRDDG